MKSFLVYGSLLILGLNSCKNTSLIERSESFLSNKPASIKLICIDPRFYPEEGNLTFSLKDIGVLEKSIKNDIIKFSKKNHIELELYDLESRSEKGYYEDLLRLKNNMLLSNFNQKTPLNFDSRLTKNEIHQKVFVYPPKIGFDFNSFSKNYGTPYFSYLGIYSVKDDVVLYHIVVDTDLGETIYREFKTIKKNIHKDIIAQMIFDSYAMLAEQLKK